MVSNNNKTIIWFIFSFIKYHQNTHLPYKLTRTILLTANFNIQKILIAPLDWGLGHATRCIPIIRALINNGYTVIIAAEGIQAILLQTEFPDLTILPLKGYRVMYSKSKWTLSLILLLQIPRLLQTIRYEHQWLDKMIKEQQIDLVISDNRYGFSSKTKPCIFITHQLCIQMPFVWLEKIIQKINYHYIDQFTRCWVPDALGEINIAGKLAHPATMPTTKVRYMGLLSRFQKRELEKKYDQCIILSGPEPQRTILEARICKTLSKIKGETLIIRGKPGAVDLLSVPPGVTVKNHLPGNEMEEAILQSEYVISRSGYTTIMELISLQKKAILIPTPGQTEQEYLATWLQQKQICLSMNQSVFDLKEAIDAAKSFSYKTVLIPVFTNDKLEELLSDV